MALIRWEPARELNSLQSEMNRLFNTFFDAPTATGGNGGSLCRWIPPMDLVETEGHYVLRADLPGMTEEDAEGRGAPEGDPAGWRRAAPCSVAGFERRHPRPQRGKAAELGL